MSKMQRTKADDMSQSCLTCKHFNDNQVRDSLGRVRWREVGKCSWVLEAPLADSYAGQRPQGFQWMQPSDGHDCKTYAQKVTP